VNNRRRSFRQCKAGFDRGNRDNGPLLVEKSVFRPKQGTVVRDPLNKLKTFNIMLFCKLLDKLSTSSADGNKANHDGYCRYATQQMTDKQTNKQMTAHRVTLTINGHRPSLCVWVWETCLTMGTIDYQRWPTGFTSAEDTRVSFCVYDGVQRTRNGAR